MLYNLKSWNKIVLICNFFDCLFVIFYCDIHDFTIIIYIVYRDMLFYYCGKFPLKYINDWNC